MWIDQSGPAYFSNTSYAAEWAGNSLNVSQWAGSLAIYPLATPQPIISSVRVHVSVTSVDSWNMRYFEVSAFIFETDNPMDGYHVASWWDPPTGQITVGDFVIELLVNGRLRHLNFSSYYNAFTVTKIEVNDGVDFFWTNYRGQKETLT